MRRVQSYFRKTGTQRFKQRRHRGRLGCEFLEDRRLLAVAAGDFNGDGREDMAFSNPYEDVGSAADAGAVNVIYGRYAWSGLDALNDQFWHQDSLGVQDVAEGGDQFGAAMAVGDFNGDGYDDLAIGIPGEWFGTLYDAGAVAVLYGSSGGLTHDGNEFLHQDTLGVEDVAEWGDRFGAALSAGDFNGDGLDDLAIGVPGEDMGGASDAGAVNLLYGSASGLTDTLLLSLPFGGGRGIVPAPFEMANGGQLWHQDSSGIEGAVETGDRFGSSLAAGDFNGDGRDDLAVGVPLEDIGAISSAGAVNVMYGSATGLTATGDQIWHQDSVSILDVAEADDYFGYSLAAGDFDGDGRDDLAVGVPFENVGAISDAGMVNVIYGSASGLTGTGDQIWHQDSGSILDAAEAGDRFGTSLAGCDFNGDGRDDLAIGVVGEDIGAISDAGAVNVIYGSASGLAATGNQFWHQDSPGIEGGAEVGDHFGSSLAVGDFNGDGRCDLAIGAYGENIGTLPAGAVNVIYGRSSTSGLTADGDQIWHQDIAGIEDSAELSDDAVLI
jgi:hypothetical protein